MALIQKGILVLCFSCVSAFGKELNLDKPSRDIRNFVADIVSSKGGADSKKFHRLPASIHVGIHSVDTYEKLCSKRVSEFFELTSLKQLEGKAVSFHGAAKGFSSKTGKLEIYIGSSSELRKKIRTMNTSLKLYRGGNYYTWTTRDGKFETYQAAIFISTDETSGAKLDDRLIELLLGVFGMRGWSDNLEESCKGTPNQVLTELQELDKRTLRFLYNAVPSGTKASEIKKLVKKEWRTASQPK